jgi:hypothetical protein
LSATNTVSTWISFAALVAASTAAVAASPDTATMERARNDVVSETLAARAAGTLTPAGEAVTPRASAASASSTLTRRAVEEQVREARAAGDLIPAGEGVALASAAARSISLVTRAEVKATVIAARKSGELVPAGEGLDAETHARAQHVAADRTARADGVTETVAKR